MSASAWFMENWALIMQFDICGIWWCPGKKLSLTVAPVLEGLAGSTQILIFVELLLGL